MLYGTFVWARRALKPLKTAVSGPGREGDPQGVQDWGCRTGRRADEARALALVRARAVCSAWVWRASGCESHAACCTQLTQIDGRGKPHLARSFRRRAVQSDSWPNACCFRARTYRWYGCMCCGILRQANWGPQGLFFAARTAPRSSHPWHSKFAASVPFPHGTCPPPSTSARYRVPRRGRDHHLRRASMSPERPQYATEQNRVRDGSGCLPPTNPPSIPPNVRCHDMPLVASVAWTIWPAAWTAAATTTHLNLGTCHIDVVPIHY
jgi:hypothetical protein